MPPNVHPKTQRAGLPQPKLCGDSRGKTQTPKEKPGRETERKKNISGRKKNISQQWHYYNFLTIIG
jgi:hypothetical protein